MAPLTQLLNPYYATLPTLIGFTFLLDHGQQCYMSPTPIIWSQIESFFLTKQSEVT